MVIFTLAVTVEPFVGAVMATVGAVVSIWISCELTASALPALSKARYFTVVVEPTEKALL